MIHLHPVTVITGASAGIGAAMARVFIRHGHELALVARRRERLEQLADEIAACGKPRPLVIVADLATPDAVKTICEALNAAGAEPQYMVNNAGFGLVGAAAMLDHEQELAMIDVNARALTDLSLAFVDSLSRHHGGILNVGSLAGFMPGPGMAVYYASKAYVLSLSEALHAELKERGVRVCVLCPGPVPTEFARRAGIDGNATPWPLVQSAERVAQRGYRGLMRGRRIVLPGLAVRLVAAIVPRVPRRFLLDSVAARQRRRSSSPGA